jgi:uncharacterized C2H2 Zn-finger protein
MDDKVKIRCPACKQVFREKANKVRDGVQLNCPNCPRLLTLNRDIDDPYIRRALKLAKEIRNLMQDQLAEKVYGASEQAPGEGAPSNAVSAKRVL